MTYSEKLKDPRWQKKRLEILQRDAFMCMECGDETATLHIHHKYYLDFFTCPWDYPNESLITLCENCHLSESENCKIEANKFILELKKTGFMAKDFFYFRKKVQNGEKVY